MPLPLEACVDNVATEVCCSTIFDIADRIRCVATDAVECCFDPSCADREWRSYVSVGPRISEPLGDALVVHMPGISPSANSRSNLGLLAVATHIARYEIFLTENGWPTIIANEYGEVIQVPDSNLVNSLAMHAYSHGEKMYRAIVDGIQQRTLFPGETFSNIGKIHIDGMAPVAPSAFAVGWLVPIQIQVTLP